MRKRVRHNEQCGGPSVKETFCCGGPTLTLCHFVHHVCYFVPTLYHFVPTLYQLRWPSGNLLYCQGQSYPSYGTHRVFHNTSSTMIHMLFYKQLPVEFFSKCEFKIVGPRTRLVQSGTKWYKVDVSHKRAAAGQRKKSNDVGSLI